MDLTPDPLQLRLARTVRGHLAASAETPAAIRGALAGVEAFGLEAPVGAGGFDLGVTAGITVCTELGRRALPDVYAGPAMALDAAVAAGDPNGVSAGIAAGDTAVAMAGMHALSECGASGQRAAERVGDGWRLTGIARIDDAAAADPATGEACCLPVLVEDSVSLALLPASSWRRLGGEDGMLELAGLVVADAELIGTVGSGYPLTDEFGVLARARLRQAAYLLGIGEGAHAVAAEHAMRRQQFGRPIGEFQAVSFPLAEVAVALSALRLSVIRAAWLADTGGAFACAAVQALARAAEVAMRACRCAVQVCGARGMSDETPMPRYYRRVRDQSTRFGSPERLWQEAGLRRLTAQRIERGVVSTDAAVH